MTVLKKAVLWSIPVWIILIVDSYLWGVGSELLFVYVHAPGLFLSMALDPSGPNVHNPSLIAQCIYNCLFYFLIVWLIVYVVHRIRQRRVAKPQA